MGLARSFDSMMLPRILEAESGAPGEDRRFRSCSRNVHFFWDIWRDNQVTTCKRWFTELRSASQIAKGGTGSDSKVAKEDVGTVS